jgi:hypothetical protein
MASSVAFPERYLFAGGAPADTTRERSGSPCHPPSPSPLSFIPQLQQPSFLLRHANRKSTATGDRGIATKPSNAAGNSVAAARLQDN